MVTPIENGRPDFKLHGPSYRRLCQAGTLTIDNAPDVFRAMAEQATHHDVPKLQWVGAWANGSDVFEEDDLIPELILRVRRPTPAELAAGPPAPPAPPEQPAPEA